MARRYTVSNFADSTGPRAGIIRRFVIADWENNNAFEWDEKDHRYRPCLASFPVSVLYDEETQRQNAKKLCEYLNAVLDAKDKAVIDDALLQKIML